MGVQPINNVGIVSGKQQRDSAIHIHVSILPQTSFPSRMPHNIEQSSVSCAVGPYWLSILNVAVQYHAIFMTVALYYSLKSGSVLAPALFIFLKIGLASQFFAVPCKFQDYSNLVKNVMVILIGMALNLQIALGSTMFISIASSDSFLQCFNSFLQCHLQFLSSAFRGFQSLLPPW